VVYFHGTAKRRDDIPFPDAATHLGIRVMMADRPGYGSSAPAPDASLLDVGNMVLDDLDRRGVDRFSLLGFSGGGPHALACAAAAPARTRAVGLLSSWAPMRPPHPGLPLGVRVSMKAAAVFPRPAIRLMFMLGRQTCAGMVDDVRRVSRSWNVDVEALASAVHILAWHAEGDPQVPAAPWRDFAGIDLTVGRGTWHETPHDVWEAALRSVAIDA
jgi:pimeloyl-ACP methyl ester carboxylesterase